VSRALAKAERYRLLNEPGEWLREAMKWYEKAEAIRPAGNDARC
jgi:hypothetical protein